jgi:hypothetical protein
MIRGIDRQVTQVLAAAFELVPQAAHRIVCRYLSGGDGSTILSPPVNCPIPDPT